MREIRTYGATSGDWKRSYGVGLRHRHRRKRPLPTVEATAPVVDSTKRRRYRTQSLQCGSGRLGARICREHVQQTVC
jgi:hypothetical protein